MRPRHVLLIGFLLAVTLFLYPYPSTGFLYRNAEVLQGKAYRLMGASVVLFLDPSFYYRFKIAPGDFEVAVAALGLNDLSLDEHDLRTMRTHGPWFWNRWWWRPDAGPWSRLYGGVRDGNRFLFLYDYRSRVAHLYIQNL